MEPKFKGSMVSGKMKTKQTWVCVHNEIKETKTEAWKQLSEDCWVHGNMMLDHELFKCDLLWNQFKWHW